jgi:hypothetical protein
MRNGIRPGEKAVLNLDGPKRPAVPARRPDVQTSRLEFRITTSITKRRVTMPIPNYTPAQARAKVLSLYRQSLRGAQKMPTPHRRRYVADRVREEYKSMKHLTQPADILLEIRNAFFQVDTILIQAEHQKVLVEDENFMSDWDQYES